MEALKRDAETAAGICSTIEICVEGEVCNVTIGNTFKFSISLFGYPRYNNTPKFYTYPDNIPEHIFRNFEYPATPTPITSICQTLSRYAKI